MSQEAFGRRLGVTGAGISKIESGDRSVTDQMILSICREFNVRENWLRFGDGEIFTQLYAESIEQMAGYYHMDELDKRIIYEYALLNEDKRKIIKEYIMRIAGEGYISTFEEEPGKAGNLPICAEGQEENLQ